MIKIHVILNHYSINPFTLHRDRNTNNSTALCIAHDMVSKQEYCIRRHFRIYIIYLLEDLLAASVSYSNQEALGGGLVGGGGGGGGGSIPAM